MGMFLGVSTGGYSKVGEWEIIDSVFGFIEARGDSQ